MTAVLALDQGTTGSTALVLSADGRVLGRGYREFTQHFPSPGEVEHDAEEILRVTVDAAREAIRQAGVTPAAIGITNQRETVCAWERATGRPVHRAIVWQDRRTAARCAQLEKQKLFDIGKRAWDRDLLKLFGVPQAALPEVRNSSGDFGTAASEHFGAALPITGVAGDQQAALFGQGCWKPGQAKNTYGTGAFLLLNTGKHRATSKRGLLTTLACGPRGEPVFALEGSVFIAGAAMQWLRDGLKIIKTAAESEQLAKSVTDTGGVYFVPAFVGLGAPHWEPNARGTIVGLTRGSERAHLVRAALEAMAFSTKEVLDAMLADAKIKLSSLLVDGGAAANDWLMQFQADVLGVAVARPDLVETTALGAAGLAGLGAGLWKSANAFLAGRTFTPFAPSAARRAVQARAAEWHRAVQTALHWAG
ncbi:MAG: glycerol kinase [Gemmatimonadetes bacterium]|nr:MAG: glycerol kinase [Gemmatimonadota bacterium]